MPREKSEKPLVEVSIEITLRPAKIKKIAQVKLIALKANIRQIQQYRFTAILHFYQFRHLIEGID
jgi:hypothetical protein